jgi:CrcB protein
VFRIIAIIPSRISLCADGLVTLAAAQIQSDECVKETILLSSQTILRRPDARRGEFLGDEFKASPAPSSSIMGRCISGSLMIYLWIGIGGALGSVARFATYGLMTRLVGSTFPWGTLTVNVVGSILIGFFAGMTEPDGRWFVNAAGRRFVMVGICGGFTTFSTFSLETLNLARDAEWLYAAVNAIASLTLCLAGVWVGHMVSVALNK